MTTGKMAEKPGHRLLATHTACAGWARLLIATIRLADGHTVEREIEDHGEAVCILPYNPVRRTAILVRQMRAPVLFAAGARRWGTAGNAHRKSQSLPDRSGDRGVRRRQE